MQVADENGASKLGPGVQVNVPAGGVVTLAASMIASMHSDAERAPIAELGRGARLLYRMLTGFCGAPAARP